MLADEISPWLPRDFLIQIINRALTLRDRIGRGPASAAGIAAGGSILHDLASIDGAESVGDGWPVLMPNGLVIRVRRATDQDIRVNKSPIGPETAGAIDVNRQLQLELIELDIPVGPIEDAKVHGKTRTVHLMYKRVGGMVSAAVIEVLDYDDTRKFTKVKPGSWDLGTWQFHPVDLGLPDYAGGVPDVDGGLFGSYTDGADPGVEVGIRSLPESFSGGPQLRPHVAERDFVLTDRDARLVLSRLTTGDRDANPRLVAYLQAVEAEALSDTADG